MKVVILQNKQDNSYTLKKVLLQEIPYLTPEQIIVLPDEKIDCISSILSFLEQNKKNIRILILDVNLKINPESRSDIRAGLKVYQRMIEQYLYEITILMTSFESLSQLICDEEFGHYFNPEQLNLNPFIQFPATISELIFLVNQILKTEE